MVFRQIAFRHITARYLWRLLAMLGIASICILLILHQRQAYTKQSLPILYKKALSQTNQYTHLLPQADIGRPAAQKLAIADTKDLDQIYIQRKDTARRACAGKEKTWNGNSTEEIVRTHFLVDQKQNLVYCYIEKIGSSFWKRIFQIMVQSNIGRGLSNPFDIPGPKAHVGDLESFKNMRFDAIHYLLDNSLKFMFSREPYQRLFSGYMDKLFTLNPAYWAFAGIHGIRMLRPNATELSLKCGHDLTFSEFVKFYINSQITNKVTDPHFDPMYDHCRPCQIKYDIIGKMETFKQDSKYILQRLGQTDLHDKIQNMDKDSRQDLFKHVAFFIFEHKNESADCITFFDSLRRTWRKLQTTGSISKRAKFPFSREESDRLVEVDFVKALKQAIGDTTDNQISEKQKEEALTEAYQSVSIEDMEKLKRIFQPDCEIFGYEFEPSKLFTRQNTKPSFSYFDITTA